MTTIYQAIVPAPPVIVTHLIESPPLKCLHDGLAWNKSQQTEYHFVTFYTNQLIDTYIYRIFVASGVLFGEIQLI